MDEGRMDEVGCTCRCAESQAIVTSLPLSQNNKDPSMWSKPGQGMISEKRTEGVTSMGWKSEDRVEDWMCWDDVWTYCNKTVIVNTLHTHTNGGSSDEEGKDHPSQ